MKKRILFMILTFVLCFCFVSCLNLGGGDSEDSSKESQQSGSVLQSSEEASSSEEGSSSEEDSSSEEASSSEEDSSSENKEVSGTTRPY